MNIQNKKETTFQGNAIHPTPPYRVGRGMNCRISKITQLDNSNG
ncbi:hypothetical protein [Coleofasciculus sp. G2-EDA-02]